MTVLGRAVFQKGHGTRQLAGSELQAELGAGLLQDSHLMTESVPGLWLAVPGSGEIIYSVFVHLSL